MGEVAGAGEVEPHVANRPHERVVLEQRPVPLQGLLQALGPVRRAQPAPGDQVCAGAIAAVGSICRNVRWFTTSSRSVGRFVEELGADRDAARVLPRQGGERPRPEASGRIPT